MGQNAVPYAYAWASHMSIYTHMGRPIHVWANSDTHMGQNIDTPTSQQKRTRLLSTKISWLLDESSNNNASNDGLSV